MEEVDEQFISVYRNERNYKYLLYTRGNPLTPQIIIHGVVKSLTNSHFKKNNEIVFLVHGWFGNADNEMNRMLTNAFLRKKELNIIVVDWSELATRNYLTAKRGVVTIGLQLGLFMSWLNYEFGISYEQIHLVGFSLGAHLVGNAGRASGGLVKRITGLDPAGPLWKRDNNRLNKNDARYVEVIHTNTALYGYSEPCGDADFYPNGGTSMPGCWFNVCSHSKGYEYMAASVLFNHLVARECPSLKDVEQNNCFGQFYPMGNSHMSKSRSGLFRVNTGNDFPF
ncbi:unnamed protein product [Leptosia nina]|uniref:Lipase domain-containing protein n=1 Tax=Leptosia nina TaxID=320188 RepID=A0AAV1J5B2_9NEOP